jgi:hypothetical protein
MRLSTLNGLHGVISQKIVLFTTTAVRTSHPTWRVLSSGIWCHWYFCLPAGHLLALLFDPEDGSVRTSETSVPFYQATRCHIPEDSIKHILNNSSICILVEILIACFGFDRGRHAEHVCRSSWMKTASVRSIWLAGRHGYLVFATSLMAECKCFSSQTLLADLSHTAANYTELWARALVMSIQLLEREWNKNMYIALKKILNATPRFLFDIPYKSIRFRLEIRPLQLTNKLTN